jgi:hypothetical protein
MPMWAMSPLIGQFGPKATFGRKERILCASVHENIPIAFYGGLVGSAINVWGRLLVYFHTSISHPTFTLIKILIQYRTIFC